MTLKEKQIVHFSFLMSDVDTGKARTPNFAEGYFFHARGLFPIFYLSHVLFYLVLLATRLLRHFQTRRELSYHLRELSYPRKHSSQGYLRRCSQLIRKHPLVFQFLCLDHHVLLFDYRKYRIKLMS